MLPSFVLFRIASKVGRRCTITFQEFDKGRYSMSNQNEPLGIFRLGINLARKMRMPVKLGLLSLVLMVPLVGAAIILYQQNQAAADFTSQELKGVAVIQPATQLINLVQRHMGQNALRLSGDTEAGSKLERLRAELAQATALLADASKTHADLSTASKWPALEQRIGKLSAETHSLSASQSSEFHSRLMRDLRNFVYAVAEESGLLYEPDAAPYLLMDMVVLRMNALTEALELARGVGAGVVKKNETDPGTQMSMRQYFAVVSNALAESRDILKLIHSKGEDDLGDAAALEAAERFLSLGQAVFAENSTTKTDSLAYFDLGGTAIKAAFDAQTQMSERLHFHLKERDRSLHASHWTRIAVAIAGLLALLYVYFSTYKSIMIDLRRMHFALNHVAAGDLRVAGSLRSSDEIGDLGVTLVRMIHNISAMVTTVGTNAAMVEHAGQDIRHGNRDLSDRTEQQAANLEQTAASVAELASTVAQNAEAATHVDAQAAQVRDIADAGAQAMRASVASVEAIQASATRMNEIIGVIDGLAFQTNILALNAAVEAARAGESGRGFAVVASEVRTLAQRSAESAREIRALIQTSSGQVSKTVTLIRTAGQSMEQIVTDIRSVSSGVSQISAASSEQSTSLREVSAAVKQLDDITQHNAQMVDRSVAQAESLTERAELLTAAVSSFKLKQGVAAEAMAMVQMAVEFRTSSGTREAFLRGLTDKHNKFYDRDMYAFVLDQRGNYLAFGGNPAKVGTRVQDVPGIDGDGLVRAVIAQADQGPGWVEYNITNPTTGTVQTKMSFVHKVDDEYLGCGVYKTLVLT
jgi:methyl-accepting chemotaxis protein